MTNENIEGVPITEELASRDDRLKAAIIDGLLSLIIVGPYLWYLYSHGQKHQDMATRLVINVVAPLAVLIIHGYFWHKYGQSVGKRMMKIRITDLSGNKPPFWKMVFLRYWAVTACGLIPVIGGLLGTIDVLLIFRKDQRCFHDQIAGTKVVKCSLSDPKWTALENG